MKATFQDFLRENPNCSKFSGDGDAIALFDFLNQDDTLIAMLDAVDRGQPALAGCVRAVEARVAQSRSAEFRLEARFAVTVIGRMVKTVLAPFGYVPKDQRGLPKSSGAESIRSAHRYQRDENHPATMRVVRRIEEI